MRQRRQQQLLLLDEMLPVIRMQRLELRLVKSQKLFNPAAAAEIAELKVILAAINLFQPQPMQPAQRWLTAIAVAISSLCFSDSAPSAIEAAAIAPKPCIVPFWVWRRLASSRLMSRVRSG